MKKMNISVIFKLQKNDRYYQLYNHFTLKKIADIKEKSTSISIFINFSSIFPFRQQFIQMKKLLHFIQ